MDIFNRPPTISEDTLHYTLFPSPSAADKASVLSTSALINSWVEGKLPNFLWHRDAFELKIASNAGSSDKFFLEGRMRVGDCVDDEWCAVWLLREISSEWEDMVISVFDSDGEFLLIEAADALPVWITPTNAENRVWIYRSQLHIVPLNFVSPVLRKRERRKLPGRNDSDDEDEDSADYLAAQDALQIIRDDAIDTVASLAVQKAVWTRVNGYPAAAASHVHSTKAYLPVDISRALAGDPALIQKPIETFYTRDAMQLRAAHRMTRFPPQPSELTTVRMTRTAYAQLVGQKFFPPKVFGQWKVSEGSDEWRWRDTGLKIAVGFEMLYQESKGKSENLSQNPSADSSWLVARKEALRRDVGYAKYIQTLVSVGFFKGEIEGSELWNELENKAAKEYLKSQREDDASRPSFASQVAAALAKPPRTATAPLYEDSDDWLNIDAKDFEGMLSRTTGTATAMDVDTPERSAVEDRVASEQADKLKDLASKVEAFVEGQGSLDGALFDDEMLSEDEEEEELTDEPDSDSDDEEMDENARNAAMDKLVPGLEPSEYGQMPASFHANSQRVAQATLETEVVVEPAPAEGSRDELKSKPIREPILPRDKFDGVDSDDDTDEELAADGDEEEEEEDRPQVVGEIEVDMGEEEDEFLEFSRQALGITDEQWGDILRDRKSRGAFVPEGTHVPAKSNTNPPKPAAQPRPEKVPEAGPRPNVNPNLDSFEAVMIAMDEELSRSRSSKKSASPSKDKGKGKQKATVADEDEKMDDIDAAMDSELRAALLREDGDEDDEEEPMDYNLIKNFLESFKSQAGLSGPVGSLASRLESGWQFPRDES